jgi:hypothetical protein
MPTRKQTSAKYGGHEIIGTVGDVDFLTYGGGEVYKNAEGEYTLEHVEPPPDEIELDDKNARWEVYRVNIDAGMPDWGSYKAAAKTSGAKPSELKAAFESDNPMERAWAYETWAGHYGWNELDEYRLVLDKHEVESRYETEIGSGDEPDEPEGEDTEEGDDPFSDEEMREGYVISDAKRGGYDVSLQRRHMKHFADKDEALDYISEHMEKEQVFPNIYYVNDHGNVDLLDEDGKILESRV